LKKNETMAFSLSKLFGNSVSIPTDSTDAIIKDVENKPFGVSEHNVLYGGLNELGGYFFFQTIIVGQLHVKVKNGAKLLFKSDDFELQLNSDMQELESEHSPVKGRSITKIDFEINESDIKKLENAKLTSIQLSVKNHSIVFSKHRPSDEEE
jgi:hypothetical protein